MAQIVTSLNGGDTVSITKCCLHMNALCATSSISNIRWNEFSASWVHNLAVLFVIVRDGRNNQAASGALDKSNCCSFDAGTAGLNISLHLTATQSSQDFALHLRFNTFRGRSRPTCGRHVHDRLDDH
jgi:hypothetical protein